MRRLIAILIAATISLSGCSSVSQKEGAKDTNNKNTVTEEAKLCGYCKKDEKDKKVYHYKTYNDIKKGSYHEECYRTLLDEKFPDDHDNAYEMVICINCNEYGESIKDWVAYGHYETKCTNCKGKLEIKKFATYEDFLLRNDEVKEETKEETTSNEPKFYTCSSCGLSNASVCYHDGIHGYFSGNYYCEPCYAYIYKRYEAEVAEYEIYQNTCLYCGGTEVRRPIEWYDGDGWVSSGYYHGVCYSNYLVEAEAYYYEHATVYCPICGYETGEYGQQYLGNHGGSTDCPQCGNEMKEHETFLK